MFWLESLGLDYVLGFRVLLSFFDFVALYKLFFALMFLKRYRPLCIGLLGLLCWQCADPDIDYKHPIWDLLNNSEDKLDEGQCVITKLGFKCMRFHATKSQQRLSDDFLTDEGSYIVEVPDSIIDIVLTPGCYTGVTDQKFPKTLQAGPMQYCFVKQDKDASDIGIPAVFLDELLGIDPMEAKDAIVIISTGITGKLVANKALIEQLKSKKKAGIIQDYEILRTAFAVHNHNKYVKQGKKVFTFIHTAG